MYAAGYLEGALTHEQIFQFATTLDAIDPMDGNVTRFMEVNLEWTCTQVTLYPNDPYWVQVGLVLAQYDGLVAGYNQHSSQPLSGMALLLVTADADTDDVKNAVHVSRRKRWDSLSATEAVVQSLSQDHCSVLIKVCCFHFFFWSFHAFVELYCCLF